MHVRPLVTVEAYLALEAVETVHRHEFWDGDLWAMTGTTPEHNDLVRAVVRQLDDQLAGGPCHAYSESIRTRVSATRYLYPDIVVACPPDFERAHKPPTLLNAKVVVEVLSESTASFDRGDKLAAYQAVDTVTDVLLLASDGFDAAHYTRAEGGWLMRACPRDVKLSLAGVSAVLDLDAAYRAAGL
ncbi:MAG: Uma2 family endonuclease [Myxococcales bacterium]|nr:Uma2 family endonuclease [Myxococcales bacterium]MCB9650481.1 Uma2 family endonuclease [Deltaproteobacteria bacterium]